MMTIDPFDLASVGDPPLALRAVSLDEEDLEEITKSFAEVDEWLRTAKTKYGIRLAEGGLDVVYDEESRRQYTEATTDDDEFERYIEATSRMQDDIVNFDF